MLDGLATDHIRRDRMHKSTVIRNIHPIGQDGFASEYYKERAEERNMKCIYCLRTEGETYFSKQEHIIPKTLGGIFKLDLSMVCDECNESFSIYEKRFVYDTPISLNKRMQIKNGRHGKFLTNLAPMHLSNEVVIGYVEQGLKPRVIPQFIVSVGDKIDFSGDSESNPEEEYKKLVKIFSWYAVSDIIHIEFTELPEKKIYLVYYKGKVFSCKNPVVSKETEENLIELITKGTLDINLESKVDSFSKPVFKQHFNYSNSDFYRIIAKIVFNTFAKYNNEIVYKDYFNLIRRYIRYGENISKIKFCYESNDVKKCITEIKNRFNIIYVAHCIYVANIPNKSEILGMISLYDEYNCVVKIGNESCEKNEVFYVNELDNNREYNLFENV